MNWKTHKYKQHKKNVLYCVSQCILCMQEKVQNVKIFNKLFYKYCPQLHNFL